MDFNDAIEVGTEGGESGELTRISDESTDAQVEVIQTSETENAPEPIESCPVAVVEETIQ